MRVKILKKVVAAFCSVAIMTTTTVSNVGAIKFVNDLGEKEDNLVTECENLSNAMCEFIEGLNKEFNVLKERLAPNGIGDQNYDKCNKICQYINSMKEVASEIDKLNVYGRDNVLDIRENIYGCLVNLLEKLGYSTYSSDSLVRCLMKKEKQINSVVLEISNKLKNLEQEKDGSNMQTFLTNVEAILKNFADYLEKDLGRFRKQIQEVIDCNALFIKSSAAYGMLKEYREELKKYYIINVGSISEQKVTREEKLCCVQSILDVDTTDQLKNSTNNFKDLPLINNLENTSTCFNKALSDDILIIDWNIMYTKPINKVKNCVVVQLENFLKNLKEYNKQNKDVYEKMVNEVKDKSDFLRKRAKINELKNKGHYMNLAKVASLMKNENIINMKGKFITSAGIPGFTGFRCSLGDYSNVFKQDFKYLYKEIEGKDYEKDLEEGNYIGKNLELHEIYNSFVGLVNIYAGFYEESEEKPKETETEQEKEAREKNEFRNKVIEKADEVIKKVKDYFEK